MRERAEQHFEKILGEPEASRIEIEKSDVIIDVSRRSYEGLVGVALQRGERPKLTAVFDRRDFKRDVDYCGIVFSPLKFGTGIIGHYLNMYGATERGGGEYRVRGYMAALSQVISLVKSPGNQEIEHFLRLGQSEKSEFSPDDAINRTAPDEIINIEDTVSSIAADIGERQVIIAGTEGKHEPAYFRTRKYTASEGSVYLNSVTRAHRYLSEGTSQASPEAIKELYHLLNRAPTSLREVALKALRLPHTSEKYFRTPIA